MYLCCFLTDYYFSITPPVLSFPESHPVSHLFFPFIRFLYCHALLYLHIRILNTNNCLRPVYADHCCFVFLISCFPDKLQQFLQYFLCQITASPVKNKYPAFLRRLQRTLIHILFLSKRKLLLLFSKKKLLQIFFSQTCSFHLRQSC